MEENVGEHFYNLGVRKSSQTKPPKQSIISKINLFLIKIMDF